MSEETPGGDAIYFKNRGLLALVGQHVIVGWDRHHKWNGGELSLVDSWNTDSAAEPGAKMQDLRRPMLWKLDLGEVRAGNRVRGYEPVLETYFVTTDIMWWAPATPREEERHPRHLEEVQR